MVVESPDTKPRRRHWVYALLICAGVMIIIPRIAQFL